MLMVSPVDVVGMRQASDRLRGEWQERPVSSKDPGVVVECRLPAVHPLYSPSPLAPQTEAVDKLNSSVPAQEEHRTLWQFPSISSQHVSDVFG